MSLKQYSPHLQLTIHKPQRLSLGVVLFSALIVSLIILSSENDLLTLAVCLAVLLLTVCIKRQLLCRTGSLIINDYEVSLGGEEFELRQLRIILGSFILINFQRGRRPILLSRGQLSTSAWQGLVRYAKLCR